jgi:hypothetical protein
MRRQTTSRTMPRARKLSSIREEKACRIMSISISFFEIIADETKIQKSSRCISYAQEDGDNDEAPREE